MLVSPLCMLWESMDQQRRAGVLWDKSLVQCSERALLHERKGQCCATSLLSPALTFGQASLSDLSKVS